jgi:DNA adenine methylase
LELVKGSRYDNIVEPFCGGAAVSLGLLEAGVVEHADISDKDELVSAFWVAAAHHTDELIARIGVEDVTVKRWVYWNTARPQTLIDKAVKALFLNRTTFSGLIHHGSVLGGIEQDKVLANGGQVKYPVDCRFNKEAISQSISRIGEWSREGRLSAARCGYQNSVEMSQGGKDLVYLDPPYMEKSDDLYGQTFTINCHRKLAEFTYVLNMYGYRVMVSYDDIPYIRSLYTEPSFIIYSPSWAYGMGKSKSSREILISNFPLEGVQRCPEA